MDRLIHRIVTGPGDRLTRFQDEEGNWVPLSGIWYAPHALISTVLRKYLGYRPPAPWLSYRAQRHIARLLRPDWMVLEFGSGMSTEWFAKRCRVLYSIEHNPLWHQAVKTHLAEKAFSNIVYTLKNEADYSDLSAFDDGFFDFVLIDGIQRTACVRSVIPKVKTGGWVYLDNTDMSAQSHPDNDYQQAEKLLLSDIRVRQGRVRYFTDFVPTNFFAKQGMLVHLT